MKRCYNCNQSGHYKKKCPEIKCRSCRKYGHMSLECTNKRCYKCEGKGHNAQDCPNEMSKTCWTCGSIRSEVYLARQGKTFYTCMKCRRIDNPEGANLPKEDVEFWTSQQEVNEEVDPVDKKLIKGSVAQKVFTNHFDIVNEILNIVKGNLMDSDGHQDFLNMCHVNRFIYHNFIHYWKRDDTQRLLTHKNVVDYIPGGKIAEKLGLTEVMCTTCRNFRGSKNWIKKHYWRKSNTWGDGMYCDYAKDSAYFRLYTRKEKEAMLKETEEEAQIKLERKRSFEKCICWKKGETYCEKHGHNIEILNSGKCKNCEIRAGKQRESPAPEGKKVRFEEQEKSVVRDIYYYDDMVADNAHQNLFFWKNRYQFGAQINYEVAMNNLVGMQQQAEIIRKLEQELLGTRTELVEYQKLFGEVKGELAEYQKLFEELAKQNVNNLLRPIVDLNEEEENRLMKEIEEYFKDDE